MPVAVMMPQLPPGPDAAALEALKNLERQPQEALSEPDSPLTKTDEFRMYCLKVLPCSKRYCHDWTSCPLSHPGEKARRRDPRVYNYTGIACPDMKKEGTCLRAEACPYAHNVFEYWLHPTRYRTQLCNDGTNCRRRVCFFAHTLDELRVPSTKPFVPPEALAAATAASAEREARKRGGLGSPSGLQGATPPAGDLAGFGAGDSSAGLAELVQRLAAMQMQAPLPEGIQQQQQQQPAMIALLTQLLRETQEQYSQQQARTAAVGLGAGLPPAYGGGGLGSNGGLGGGGFGQGPAAFPPRQTRQANVFGGYTSQGPVDMSRRSFEVGSERVHLSRLHSDPLFGSVTNGGGGGMYGLGGGAGTRQHLSDVGHRRSLDSALDSAYTRQQLAQLLGTGGMGGAPPQDPLAAAMQDLQLQQQAQMYGGALGQGQGQGQAGQPGLGLDAAGLGGSTYGYGNRGDSLDAYSGGRVTPQQLRSSYGGVPTDPAFSSPSHMLHAANTAYGHPSQQSGSAGSGGGPLAGGASSFFGASPSRYAPNPASPDTSRAYQSALYASSQDMAAQAAATAAAAAAQGSGDSSNAGGSGHREQQLLLSRAAAAAEAKELLRGGWAADPHVGVGLGGSLGSPSDVGVGTPSMSEGAFLLHSRGPSMDMSAVDVEEWRRRGDEEAARRRSNESAWSDTIMGRMSEDTERSFRAPSPSLPPVAEHSPLAPPPGLYSPFPAGGYPRPSSGGASGGGNNQGPAPHATVQLNLSRFSPSAPNQAAAAAAPALVGSPLASPVVVCAAPLTADVSASSLFSEGHVTSLRAPAVRLASAPLSAADVEVAAPARVPTLAVRSASDTAIASDTSSAGERPMPTASEGIVSIMQGHAMGSA